MPIMSQQANQYIFQADWFSHNVPSLSAIFDAIKPIKVLEIGSFEGRSTIFFIEKALQNNPNLEIHCVDLWGAAGKTQEKWDWDMTETEKHFDHNVNQMLKQHSNANVNFVKHKNFSHMEMIKLLAKGKNNYFDFIYIDGSHRAPDVLFDALLAHRLVRLGGVLAFDDYLWTEEKEGQQNHYNLVKPAVDHYVNTYQQKVRVLQVGHIYQQYIQKLAD